MSPIRTTAYFCFDPRDPAQSITDRATWRLSDNAVLISATMLFATYGEKYPICWEKVAALASLCADLGGDLDVPQAADAPEDRFATLDETNAMLHATLARSTR